MAHCTSCGEDHEARLLNPKAIKSLASYGDELKAIIDKVVADNSLGENHVDQQEVKVSFLNTLAALLIGQSGILSLEQIEEQQPSLTSREQLAHSFSFMVSDVMFRMRGVFEKYANEGRLPDIATDYEKAMEDFAHATKH